MNDPGAIGVMDNWSRAEVSDYIGWFMDTGNLGSPRWFNAVDSSGTFNIDIVPGLVEFIQLDSSAAFGQNPPPASKKDYKWGMAIDYTMGYSLFKSEIDNKRPSILIFKYWNPIPTPLTHVDSASTDTFFVFEWGPETRFTENPDDPYEQWNFEDGDYGMGHAVTGVSYCENFDPDGAGSLFQPGTWVIVHDNWSSTPMNVALPWKYWKVTVPVKVYPPSSIAHEDNPAKKDNFMLGQNYPNPFNATTTIQFALPKKEHVKIEVYSVMGREVETLLDKSVPAGHYCTEFNTNNLASGVYVVRIEVGEFRAARKMLYLR